MNRRKVEKLAKELGAELSRPYAGYSGNKEVTCDAPDGYWFNEGSCTQLVSVYQPHFGETASDAYEDIYERLQFGIEAIPEESKYLYQ